MPGSRFRIELTVNHIRDLYGDRLPRVLYIHSFFADPAQRYRNDVILWQLFDGTWTQPPTAGRMQNFSRLFREIATRGSGNAAYPIIAVGRNWMCFDVTTMFGRLPDVFLRLGPPTAQDYGRWGKTMRAGLLHTHPRLLSAPRIPAAYGSAAPGRVPPAVCRIALVAEQWVSAPELVAGTAGSRHRAARSAGLFAAGPYAVRCFIGVEKRE